MLLAVTSTARRQPTILPVIVVFATTTMLPCGRAIQPADVPSFRFTCWAYNPLDPFLPPPPRPPATITPKPCKAMDVSRQSEPTTSSPSPSPPCGPGRNTRCIDGRCCVNMFTEDRPSCAGNASAYGFVLGGKLGPRGTWYNPGTWDSVSVTAGSDWGNWSEEFTPDMASVYVNASTFNTAYKMLPAQIGVRSTRLDNAVLNITCFFLFTGSARISDAGKSAIVSARIPNSNCSNCRGWTGMTGDDEGGYIGLMIGRDGAGEPSVLNFASFNRQQYFSQMSRIPQQAKRAALFPIIDQFDTDGDLTTQEEGFAILTQTLGVNTPTGTVLPSDWNGRRVGIPWGAADLKGVWGHGGVLGVGGEFRKGTAGTHSVPCYTPDSSCTMHDYTVLNATDEDIVNSTDILGEVGATFPSPIPRGNRVASALADEPGWHAPFWVPVTTSTIVKQRWVSFLQARGLSPEDIGVKSWDDAIPISDYPVRTPALSLPSKRLFYWSIRFIHWDSCRYLAEWTAALQASTSDSTFQAYVNWNNFDGRMYAPGHGPFESTTTAQMSYDWFEWARMKGGSMLWTEDWMPSRSSHRWSYYAARMRSAVTLANTTGKTEFSGYIVVGSAAGRSPMAGALLQRPLTLVGSGSKLVRYYNFGPDYMFPGNSYSDSANASLLWSEIAQANSMIAAAEHVLWTARRPTADVAILYPRSSTMWDQWHFANNSRGGLCMCCCTSSMIEHYIDYAAETYGWYLALATDSNIPVDFIDEDALEEPDTLSRYKLIVVTQPNIPVAGMGGLAQWVRSGGTIVTVSAAGIADEYDEPNDTLNELIGVREDPRNRIVLLSEIDVNIGQPYPLPQQNGTATLGSSSLRFSAQAAVGKLTPLLPDDGVTGVENLAIFDNGSPAITSNSGVRSVGMGRAIHFAWLPGLSYWFSQSCTQIPGASKCTPIGNAKRSDSIRQIIAAIPELVGLDRPVTVSRVRVETPLMLTPTQDAAAVTFLNFQASTCSPTNETNLNCVTPPISSLSVNVTLPFTPSSVTSVTSGPVQFQHVAMGSRFVISFSIPLEHADFVLFEK